MFRKSFSTLYYSRLPQVTGITLGQIFFAFLLPLAVLAFCAQWKLLHSWQKISQLKNMLSANRNLLSVISSSSHCVFLQY